MDNHKPIPDDLKKENPSPPQVDTTENARELLLQLFNQNSIDQEGFIHNITNAIKSISGHDNHSISLTQQEKDVLSNMVKKSIKNSAPIEQADLFQNIFPVLMNIIEHIVAELPSPER